MDEKKVERSIVLNFRGDIRDLATLVYLYEELGYSPRSRAGVIRIAVHDWAMELAKAMDLEPFEDRSEAYRFLRQRRLVEEGGTGVVRALPKLGIKGKELGRTLPEEVENLAQDPEVKKRAEALRRNDVE